MHDGKIGPDYFSANGLIVAEYAVTAFISAACFIIIHNPLRSIHKPRTFIRRYGPCYAMVSEIPARQCDGVPLSVPPPAESTLPSLRL